MGYGCFCHWGGYVNMVNNYLKEWGVMRGES